MAKHIYPHEGVVKREHRERLLGQRGVTLWFTGLSGAGKSTLAVAVEEALHKLGNLTYILDGDNIRSGINNNLSFSPEDRKENIRRIAEIAKLFRESGVITLTAFISPYREDRQLARDLAGSDDFIEVFADASLDSCEERDPKGLYKKARAGQIPEFTGISAPYEAPENPEIHIRTDQNSVEDCVEMVLSYLREKKLIQA
ncbi:adenylyl-sulfate kinase [Alcanivorax sp. 1008]|uniref:adenylyl-sulfate kinase n=1 Tax=Alcanivorax sp. 1008 TaxID=2816853 RepID=UPI001D83597A|nr:adenylyl-sulfate kinase [Alcanivorax sp. 1008]MCC1496236.1 adenylyl-sulfate kinase [Alcanivorax sp. 1008]